MEHKRHLLNGVYGITIKMAEMLVDMVATIDYQKSRQPNTFVALQRKGLVFQESCGDGIVYRGPTTLGAAIGRILINAGWPAPGGNQ